MVAVELAYDPQRVCHPNSVSVSEGVALNTVACAQEVRRVEEKEKQSLAIAQDLVRDGCVDLPNGTGVDRKRLVD
jgi:hypothetical protein